MGPNFVVPPRSWADIEKLTLTIRESFGLHEVPSFPIISLLEQVLDGQLGMLNFQVGSDDDMDGAEGLTCPSGKFVMLHEDVYEAACNNDGRARFTACHEFGHWSMHTNVPMARAPRHQKVPAYRLSEEQANRFAVELLMPVRFFLWSDDENSVMERFGVSRSAAQNRLKDLRSKGRIP